MNARLLLLFALLLCLARSVAAEGQKSLAVLQFVVGKGVSVERETFTARLQNAALKAAPGFSQMTQANILSMIQAQGKTLDECEGECAVDTGRRLGADFIVTGRISKVGRGLGLSMQLYDSASGQLLAGEDLDGANEEQLLAAVSEAAPRLFAPLAARVGGGGPVARSGQSEGREARIEESGAQVDFGGGNDLLVKIQSDPPGAVVLVDGRLLCQSAPCSKMVAAGAHEFTFQKEGFEGAVQRLQVKKGLTVAGRLLRSTATLSIDTAPRGLPISLDGSRIGASPIAGREVPPGAHEVVIDDACWLRVGEKVVLKKGAERSLSLVGKPRMAGLRLSAEDEKGNAVEASAALDDQPLGTLPNEFKVPVCSKRLVVEHAGSTAEQLLSLKEGKVETIRLVLRRPAASPVQAAAPSPAEEAEPGFFASVVRSAMLYPFGVEAGAGAFFERSGIGMGGALSARLLWIHVADEEILEGSIDNNESPKPPAGSIRRIEVAPFTFHAGGPGSKLLWQPAFGYRNGKVGDQTVAAEIVALRVYSVSDSFTWIANLTYGLGSDPLVSGFTFTVGIGIGIFNVGGR
jgi:TolB-like protein